MALRIKRIHVDKYFSNLLLEGMIPVTLILFVHFILNSVDRSGLRSENIGVIHSNFLPPHPILKYFS